MAALFDAGTARSAVPLAVWTSRRGQRRLGDGQRRLFLDAGRSSTRIEVRGAVVAAEHAGSTAAKTGVTAWRHSLPREGPAFCDASAADNAPSELAGMF